MYIIIELYFVHSLLSQLVEDTKMHLPRLTAGRAFSPNILHGSTLAYIHRIALCAV